jgi:hypothetical protein
VRTAIGAVLAIGVISPAVAQPPEGYKEPPAPYRPAKDANETKDISSQIRH